MNVRVQLVDDGGHVADEAEIEFDDPGEARDYFAELAEDLEADAEAEESDAEYARLQPESSEGSE